MLQFLPIDFPEPVRRSLGDFLSSTEGQQTMHHNWGLPALSVAMLVFNTVLGEELLFRGLLLPRMQGAFGRADWIVNAVLMGLHHVHQPWTMPSSVVAGALFAYPTKRWRTAWFGIIAHSAQSVFFLILFLIVVLK